MEWVFGAGLMVAGLIGAGFAGIGAGIILCGIGILFIILGYGSKEKAQEIKRMRGY